MNTSFEKSKNSTDEWYTPKEIIDALGEFDLDPCAPMRPLWRTARVMYNKEQDGLKQKWEGRVWLNPPYSRPTIEHFITRMVEHNNAIYSEWTVEMKGKSYMILTHHGIWDAGHGLTHEDTYSFELFRIMDE